MMDLLNDQISDKVGWSESKVKQYGAILSNVVTTNLDLAKHHQHGRVTDEVTMVTVDFNERWFREITKLNPENQKKIIKMFIESKGKLKGVVLKQNVSKFEMYESMVKYLNETLIDISINKEAIIKDIYDGIYQSMARFERYITQLNESAKNKLLYGDCLSLLSGLEDESIALLLTDPPYGTNYATNRRIVTDKLSESIHNDGPEAFELFESMFKLIQPKMLPDAHAYIFASWKTYSQFEKAISQYMDIKNVIVWNKMTHSAGDLDNYSDKYELIIFATNGNRKLNGTRDTNIMQYSRVAGNEKTHPTQKPVELLRHLIEKSTSPGEYVCDPFMGVGSTVKACTDRNPYIGIELDERYYKIAKSEVCDNEQKQ